MSRPAGRTGFGRAGCLGLGILLALAAAVAGSGPTTWALALAVLLLLAATARSRRPGARSLPPRQPVRGDERGTARRPHCPDARTAPASLPAGRAPATRQPVPARLRFRVLERDGFRCRYCGRSAREEGVALHADHVVPLSAGGLTTEGNLVTACAACNLGKGALVASPSGAVARETAHDVGGPTASPRC